MTCIPLTHYILYQNYLYYFGGKLSVLQVMKVTLNSQKMALNFYILSYAI